MKVGIVKSSQLKQCWSAAQVTKCVGCVKYKDCKLEQRQQDSLYDNMLEARSHHLRRMRILDRQLRYYESHRTLEGFDVNKVE